jgi:DNA-binding IclR family transcriptional regulator
MSKQAPRVEAVDRALALLLALADAGPGGATLAELAATAEVNKATAHRALATLRARGFAMQQTTAGPYVIGPAAMQLADRAFTPANLARALHPALVALSHEADELVHLGILVGTQVQYLDKVEPERAIRVWSAIGQLVPVASTAMGRALLAARGVTGQRLDEYLPMQPADKAVSAERLRSSVEAATTMGYAVELGENEPGVACVGVALMHGSSAVAAVSITAMTSRMSAGRQRELARMISRVVPPLLPSDLSLHGSRPAEPS